MLFVFLVCIVCPFLAPSTSVGAENSDEEEEAEVSDSFICQPRYWHYRHALLLTNLAFFKTHSVHTEMCVVYPLSFCLVGSYLGSFERFDDLECLRETQSVALALLAFGWFYRYEGKLPTLKKVHCVVQACCVVLV